jgi:hypothetical protein
MKTFARITSGVVVEVIEVPDAGPPIAGRFHPSIVATLKEVPNGTPVEQGWTWAEGKFAVAVVPAPAQPPVPTEISRRQMLLAMTGAAIITQAEALDAARTGAVPAAIEAAFAKLPAADAFAARVTWASMTVVLRGDPLVAALAASRSMTTTQVDDLFRTASAL